MNDIAIGDGGIFLVAGEMKARSVVRPKIKPHLKVEVIQPDTVYLLGERSTHVLKGTLYCRLVPLLDGTKTLAEVYRILDDLPEKYVDYALERLIDKCYIEDGTSPISRQHAAFWSDFGVDSSLVSNVLSRWGISLRTLGNADANDLKTELQELGCRLVGANSHHIAQLAPEHELLVVVTDDYLNPQLAGINQEMLRADRPWLLVKIVGNILWLGPFFNSDSTGCWECLAKRLRDNSPVNSSVLRQKEKQAVSCGKKPESVQESYISLVESFLPATLAIGNSVTALEISKWILSQEGILLCNEKDDALLTRQQFVTFDYKKLAYKVHPVRRRPQCAVCGDPGFMTKQGYDAIELQPRLKIFTADGGHRTSTPVEVVRKYAHLVSPLSGIISNILRVSRAEDELVHNYTALHAFVNTATTLGGLRSVLRITSSGKGKTDSQSRASGLCEGLERYSSVFQGDEPRVRASLAELGADAIDPQQCMLYSDHQYEYRAEINHGMPISSMLARIPARLAADRQIDWTPVWSLNEGRQKFLPTEFCYFGYPATFESRVCFPDSNGNAAGNSLEEAILQGYLELIERDCIAIWWYNSLARPSVNLASFNVPYFKKLHEYYEGLGRELWVLDLTMDFQVPVFIALSRKKDGGAENIIAGFGAHLDPALGIERALTEMNQVGLQTEMTPLEALPPETKNWFAEGSIERYPFLRAAPDQATRTASDYCYQPKADLTQDLSDLIDRVKHAGLETLVLNLTRPDVGLNVVKVIVPGLRPHWMRFAPGRLYDIPVQLGLRKEKADEQELNHLDIPWL